MKLLIDEMFPAASAEHLRSRHGLDALHVSDVGLLGRPDTKVAAKARSTGRAVVTENVADFAGFEDLVVLVVWKSQLAPLGGQANDLASVIALWSADNPDPAPGIYWPASAVRRGSPSRPGQQDDDASGLTARSEAGIYMHRSHDLVLTVDASCVGLVLELVEGASPHRLAPVAYTTYRRFVKG